MDFDNNLKVQKLVERLKMRLKSSDLNENDYSIDTLKMEIYNALMEYYNDRHFTPTENEPYEDLYSFIIIELAMASITKFGAEGENYHSEGGIIRTYDNGSQYPLTLTKKIIPLAKGVDM